MKKRYLSVATILLVAASLGLNSCIGSFSLTKKVISWNQQVGNKFVNELVFFAFWILPVYEVTSLADMLVINSIEFWSGTNPITASTKTIETEHGRYLVDCDGTGYTITHEPTGQTTRLNFDMPTQTWSVEVGGEDIPFMTYIDSNTVKMLSPEGGMQTVCLDAESVMAYQEEVQNVMGHQYASLMMR